MKHILLLLIGIILLSSCSNNSDYLIDGGLSQQNVNKTTYDFLKSNKQLDTLALLIQKADMVGIVNTPNTTLFAPNNAAIKNYVNAILIKKRELDPQATFTINDIPIPYLKNALGNYIFNQRLERKNLVKEGKIYTTFSGEERLLSLEPTPEYRDQLPTFPEYVYYTFKVGLDWDSTDNVVDDKKTVVRTSNVFTTTGVVHVLQGNHVFSNYIEP